MSHIFWSLSVKFVDESIFHCLISSAVLFTYGPVHQTLGVGLDVALLTVDVMGHRLGVPRTKEKN